MGDNPDHLRLMLRETAARTAGVAAPRSPWARLAALFGTIFAGRPADSEVK